MAEVKAREAAQITALVALLKEHEKAKVTPDPEANPFAKHTLKQLAHGVRKGMDNIPALNMAAKADTPAAQALEEGRFAEAKKGREDKSAQRMARAKARALRKVELDKIVESPVQPSPERMTRAWGVVFHMVLIVSRIAKSKQRWAGRYLGSVDDDVAQMTLENMALIVAKQDKHDLDVLREAAEQMALRERGMPGDQAPSDESDPTLVKEVKKARKWLMQVANNRVQAVLVDTYFRSHNLRWQNIDLIASVMASINGPGDDPMMARFKADRAPAMLGTRFQTPGGIHPDVMAVAITAAITARGLDPLVEFILNDEHRRTDGAVEWTKHAEAIFLLTPGGQGQWMWDAVCKATANHARRDNARGQAAMRHVRNLFEWLPGLVVAVADALDPQFRYWNDGHAVMASDFEWDYLPESEGPRRPLAPALKYESVEAAAQALLSTTAPLSTGQDLVASVVHA